jgi:hypothetical protein
MIAKACVLEFGTGVGVHGRDSTKAVCRACAAITVSVEYPGASG